MQQVHRIHPSWLPRPQLISETQRSQDQKKADAQRAASAIAALFKKTAKNP